MNNPMNMNDWDENLNNNYDQEKKSKIKKTK